MNQVESTMQMENSSRHQHIIGKFGEYVVCNWLSLYGFEVAIVDHTGLDLIAYNQKTKQRIGITVKSRTREHGTERDSVNVFSYRKVKNDRQKLNDACESFGCEPWIAVYVEAKKQFADLYLTSLDNYDRKYRTKESRAIDTWKMSRRYIRLYETDKEIKHIRADFNISAWNW